MQAISFKRHRFPPEFIRHAVWLYARFTLSYRDVEDLLAERGLDISYETVRRWFLKFGAPIARNLRRMRPTPSDYWHLDSSGFAWRSDRQGTGPSGNRFWSTKSVATGTGSRHWEWDIELERMVPTRGFEPRTY